MGKKLNGRLFRVNGKPFRVNGELFRVHGKLFHIDFSSCEGSFLAIIGMFGWVVRRFQEANKKTKTKAAIQMAMPSFSFNLVLLTRIELVSNL